ncbi:MAG: hypothetical protein COZ56_21315 [Armatimonadetes bacterium CG_4_8_14_3_um_filter_58_9]|nr:MAG: hypothetical protein COZ56_21315 [Armatimonadetes bacterium CG_4_8_14_3_um_filter_58_9]
MTKGLQRSLSRGPKATKDVVHIKLALSEALTFTGSTGVAVFATAIIDLLPEGNLLYLGGVSNLTFTGPTSVNLADNFQGTYAIGTSATADVTLNGTEVDLIASTAIPAATNEIIANVRAMNAAQAILNNTDGSLEVNLNVTLNADTVTNAQSVVVTVTGTVDLVFIVLGDD